MCIRDRVNGREYLIGEGEPAFTVKFQKSIPLSERIRSTALALGEAYMDQEPVSYTHLDVYKRQGTVSYLQAM